MGFVQMSALFEIFVALIVSNLYEWIAHKYILHGLGKKKSSFFYYFAHRKSHLDVQWGKKWMPWHFDHHMGKNQDLNWCVVFPLWDHILGTRKKDDKKD